MGLGWQLQPDRNPFDTGPRPQTGMRPKRIGARRGAAGVGWLAGTMEEVQENCARQSMP